LFKNDLWNYTQKKLELFCLRYKQSINFNYDPKWFICKKNIDTLIVSIGCYRNYERLPEEKLPYGGLDLWRMIYLGSIYFKASAKSTKLTTIGKGDFELFKIINGDYILKHIGLE